MCGLAGGMASTLSNQEIHRIKMLMILATFRGMYGSGATVVHPGKTKTLGLTVCKTECCAAELICEPSFVEAIGKSPKIISAHARAPTKGGNAIKNVHPHRSGHITGVHNGTMWQVMGQKIKDDESDSAAIFAGIAEHGIEAFMKESRGAYSLVWTDTKEGTLNFLRNDARPLVLASVGWSNRTSTMYWSSEMGMLEFMLKRERVDTKDVRFDSPKPFQHIKFPLDVRPDIVPLSIKQYEDPVVVTARPYHYRGAAGAASWEDTLWDYDDSQELTGDISDRIAKQKQAREAEEARLNALQKARVANLPAVRRPMSNVVIHPSVLPNVEDILKNGARRRTASESTFRPSSADDKDVAVLLRSGGCCICDDTPQVIRRNGTLIYPKVYPVKFGAGWPQYICRDCVKSNNPLALSILPSALLH